MKTLSKIYIMIKKQQISHIACFVYKFRKMSTKLTKGENGKKGITFFQQHNFRVVQLEFDKWRPLSKMIPNNLLQHPMSGKPTWLPGYVVEEGGQTLSPEQPPPHPVPASAATPVVNSVIIEQLIPIMPPTPDDMRHDTSTESVRQTDRAKVFVVEAAEGSTSTVMCQGDQDIGPDLTREGPFDACEVEPEPGQSPLVLNSMPGCQFRMTSYDDRDSRDDLDPAYGIHLHDPRMMEYMGAPESARLLGRSPEY